MNCLFALMRRLLLFAVLAQASDCDDDQSGTCLLSLRSKAGRTGEGDVQQWTDFLLQRAQVEAKPQAFSIDEFIHAQLNAADHCHSRLLEARRTLDGVEGQVMALSSSIGTHHEVLVTNTKLLKDAIAEKDEVNGQWLKAYDDCENEPVDAAIAQYQRELEELKNIAAPEVRSSIAYGAKATDYAQEAREYVDKVSQDLKTNQTLKDVIARNLSDAHGISALEWGATQCRKFAAFLSVKGAVANYTELNCNETRENLQTEFTKAYNLISDLYDKAVKQAKDDLDDCKRMADEIRDGKLAELDNKIREATTNIFQARGMLDELLPLHQKLSRNVERLQEHLEDLREKCSEEGEVSEHLERIRRLIRTLDACPGRNDFVLEIPEER